MGQFALVNRKIKRYIKLSSFILLYTSHLVFTFSCNLPIEPVYPRFTNLVHVSLSIGQRGEFRWRAAHFLFGRPLLPFWARHSLPFQAVRWPRPASMSS